MSLRHIFFIDTKGKYIWKRDGSHDIIWDSKNRVEKNNTTQCATLFNNSLDKINS